MKVVATVYCGTCRDERRPRPERLGDVFERTWEGRPPQLLWHGLDDPSAQKMRRYAGEGEPPRTLHSWVVIADPEDSDLVVPETLTVWCNHHRAGSVSTADVIEKRGKVPIAVTY